jgi:uncharacterized membrane protein
LLLLVVAQLHHCFLQLARLVVALFLKRGELVLCVRAQISDGLVESVVLEPQLAHLVGHEQHQRAHHIIFTTTTTGLLLVIVIAVVIVWRCSAYLVLWRRRKWQS